MTLNLVIGLEYRHQFADYVFVVATNGSCHPSGQVSIENLLFYLVNRPLDRLRLMNDVDAAFVFFYHALHRPNMSFYGFEAAQHFLLDGFDDLDQVALHERDASR